MSVQSSEGWMLRNVPRLQGRRILGHLAMTITLHWWMLSIALPIIGGIISYIVGSRPHGDYDFGTPMFAFFIFVGSVVAGVSVAIGHWIG